MPLSPEGGAYCILDDFERKGVPFLRRKGKVVGISVDFIKIKPFGDRDKVFLKRFGKGEKGNG